MKNKRKTIKDDAEKSKMDDEITGMEASIETYRSNIKTETTTIHKIEEEEQIITTKITQQEETVKKLEVETQKIEDEAKKIDDSSNSETASKVTAEVKKRKK